MSGTISFVGTILENGACIPQAVSNDFPLPVKISGGIGGLTVAGSVPEGGAAGAQFPVVVGGVDPATGLVHRLAVDPAGAIAGNVQGPAAPGAIANPNPLVTGGRESGGNVRTFAVDAAGNQFVIGRTANGAADDPRPLVGGGRDAAGNVRTLAVDAAGVQFVAGQVANGAAANPSPLVIGGRDAAGNVRTLWTNAAGNLLIAGDVAAAGRAYETVPAGTASQPLGAAGAVGDVLDSVWLFPATTAPGAVTIFDGNVAVWTWPAGIIPPDLRPIFVPLNLKAIVAATPGWRITTGANISALGTGQFT